MATLLSITYSLKTQDTAGIDQHAAGFVRLIEVLRDDRYVLTDAAQLETVAFDDLPGLTGANT